MILAFYVFIPFVFTNYLHKNFMELWRPSYKRKVGSLYLGINPDKEASIYFNFLFLMRRTVFVFLTFIIPD
jgi:hypothetical protein